MTEICDGNTVARVDCLIKEAKLFHKLCETDLDRADEVISCGVQLIQKAACPRDIVQPKCDELSRIRCLITDRLHRRHETLKKSRELMDRVEKVRCNNYNTVHSQLQRRYLLLYIVLKYRTACAMESK